MKRQVSLILLALALALGVQGCNTISGSGDVVEEERPVSGFSGVHLSGIGTVTIELGDQEALVIEAEDNLLEYFETGVRNGTLWIEQQDLTNLRPKEPVNFYVTMKSLDSIAISGSGEVKAPPVSAERLSLDVSGSGDIEIEDLDADSLEVTISGSGTASIAGGGVETQDVNISGSGEYDARNMESATTNVRISGSGEATVWASDQLQVDVSGSGDVRYAGNPSVNENVSGSGDVVRIGE
jgi:predicted small secreted protein